MSKGKSSPLPAMYDSFLQELKDRIRSAQVRAALSVNRELVVLYWSIGRDILSRQKNEGWAQKSLIACRRTWPRRSRKCVDFEPGT